MVVAIMEKPSGRQKLPKIVAGGKVLTFTKLYIEKLCNDPGRNRILQSDPNRLKITPSSTSLVDDFDIALRKHGFSGSQFVHIGSGSYADVFRQQSEPGYIFKLIRLLPDYLHERIQTPDVNRTTKYGDAFSEYQILATLSKLNKSVAHSNSSYYSCQMFPLVYKGFLAKGDLPTHFQMAQHKKDRNNAVADYFLNIGWETMVIVMEDCGQPIRELLDLLPPYALLSIAKQMLVGFMVAEMALEFEHRDLHTGNVLLQVCANEYIVYHTPNKTIRIPSYGYRVKIIDTTFSRIRLRQKVHYSDLSHLFGNHFNQQSAELKMQDWAYEQMARIINDKWSDFHPGTNVIWLKYIIHKLLRSKMLTAPPEPHIHHSTKVFDVLSRYYRLMDKCVNSSNCFNIIIRDSGLNDCVKILLH